MHNAELKGEGRKGEREDRRKLRWIGLGLTLGLEH